MPGRPGDLPGISTRPNRPTTLPARPGIDNRPGFGQRPEQPTTLPGIADNRPGGRPERPARPNRPDNWQNVVNNNQDQWNSWRQQNQTTVNNFQVNRTNNWNNITNNYHNDGWSGRFGSDEYWEWRGDVLDFRRDRCNEVWDRREDFWDDMFDHHWWGSCWWAPPRPYPYYGYGVNVSPWWSWRPVMWASIGAFFGNALAPKPVVYDPGTTVIYEGDTVYINGKAADNATEARRTAAVLATPVVEQVPVPEPAPEGQPEQWMPLGVWALTQQEQGDATMFLQISVDKQGIVAGAYKNVLTGDEQPVIGRVDLPTQRVAWHVGEASQTVYETSLGNFENDVASVFVHFGDNATQTWLLVRLPSPEIPPSTVKLPNVKPE